MQHLDDGSLQAWLDRSRSGLDEAERAEIEGHLAQCAGCRERLARLDGMTARLGSLLPAAEPAPADVPDWEAVVARARVHRKAQKRRPVWTTVAWAAGIAAVMGLGWLSNDLYRSVEAARQVRPPVAAASEEEDVARVAADPGPPVLRGRVTDGSGRPLASAQVFVRGTRVGALTNEDGAFAVSLPDTAVGPEGREVTLSAQLIGYAEASRELVARAGDTVSADLRMVQQTIALDELVVTGATVAEPAAGSRRLGLSVSPTDPLWGGPWTPVSRMDAEIRVGFPLLVVADRPLAVVEVGSVEGTPVARITQELGDGARLTLIEAGTEVWFEDDRPSGAGGSSRASTRRGDVWIVATAPVPTDSLDALLRRLR